MTTHPPHPAGREHGADTQGRFNYQYQVAALYALGLLEKHPQYRAMYLEWHEDFLMVGQEGNLTLVQVKTREEHLAEVSLGDELFLKVLKGFLAKDKILGSLVSNFVFACDRSVSAGLVRSTGGSLSNPLRCAQGDWQAVWQFLTKEYPSLNRVELGTWVASVMNRIKVDQGLPRRADGIARVVQTIRAIVPNLGRRTHDDLNKMAVALLDEIAMRSSEPYDLVARVQRSTTNQAVLNAIAQRRRLDASDVRQILGLHVVGPGRTRQQRAHALIVAELAKIPEPIRADLAHDAGLDWGSSLVVEEMAVGLVGASLKDVIIAVENLKELGKPLGKILCLARYLGEAEAADFNQKLNVNVDSSVGAVVKGRNYVRSGEAYVQAARLSLASWPVAALDEELGERSDSSLMSFVEETLRKAINSQGPRVSLARELSLLSTAQRRVVLLVVGHQTSETIRRILASLPANARLLYVVPSETEPPPHELIKLPAPDPEADDGFATLAL